MDKVDGLGCSGRRGRGHGAGDAARGPHSPDRLTSGRGRSLACLTARSSGAGASGRWRLRNADRQGQTNRWLMRDVVGDVARIADKAEEVDARAADDRGVSPGRGRTASLLTDVNGRAGW